MEIVLVRQGDCYSGEACQSSDPCTVGGTGDFETRDNPKMVGVCGGKIVIGQIGITVTIYRLEFEFFVFLSLVSELTFSSSHSAPLVTNLNDCLTDKQLSIYFTKRYLNHLLSAVSVSYKGMSYGSFQ